MGDLTMSQGMTTLTTLATVLLDFPETHCPYHRPDSPFLTQAEFSMTFQSASEQHEVIFNSQFTYDGPYSKSIQGFTDYRAWVAQSKKARMPFTVGQLAPRPVKVSIPGLLTSYQIYLVRIKHCLLHRPRPSQVI